MDMHLTRETCPLALTWYQRVLFPKGICCSEQDHKEQKDFSKSGLWGLFPRRLDTSSFCFHSEFPIKIPEKNLLMQLSGFPRDEASIITPWIEVQLVPKMVVPIICTTSMSGNTHFQIGYASLVTLSTLFPPPIPFLNYITLFYSKMLAN